MVLVLAVVAAGGIVQVASAAAAPDPAEVIKGDPSAEVVTFAAPSAPGAVSQAIVVLPSEYRASAAGKQPAEQKRYPVVYLLHGYGSGCTSWYTKPREAGRPLSFYADRYGLILVCVDGKPASWYLDAPPDSEDAANWQIETMFTKHLVPEIDRRYRTWAEPAGRGVLGLSMGGHGAIYLTARHPELLSVCGDMSGLLDLTHVINKQDLTKRLGPIDKTRERWLEHSAFMQAEKFVGRRVGVLLDCGAGDPFFPDHRELDEKLTRLQIPHEFMQRPGGHDWPFWLNALPYHLQFASDRLRAAGVASDRAALPKFTAVAIAPEVPDAQDLEITDMNADGRPDVVLGVGGAGAWYENPGWGRHALDGLATQPSGHPMRWGDINGDRQRELLTISGQGGDCKVLALHPPREKGGSSWTTEVITDKLPGCRDIVPVRFVAAPFEQVLAASADGVHVLSRDPASGAWTSRQLGIGAQTGSGARGTLTMALGQLRGRQRFLAAIEPNDSSELVVYLEPAYGEGLWKRVVIGKAGAVAAVGCGDLNGDGDDEIVAAGADGLGFYTAGQQSAMDWRPHPLEAGAGEVRAIRIADLNADKRLDVVVVGARPAGIRAYMNADSR